MRKFNTFKKEIIDLNQVGIGFKLPFNSMGVFSLTYSSQEQIKYNLLNLLLTNKGEKISDPNFGCNLYNFIFENDNEELYERIENDIRDSVSIYLSKIQINNIDFNLQDESLNVSINYTILHSNIQDNINIDIT